MNKQLVFVYGTLKEGGVLHDQLGGDAILVDDAAAVPEYTLYMYPNSTVPVMVREAGKEVEGEVYAVDWKDITRLDKVEGEGRLYQRHKVTMCNGVKAWAYIWVHGVSGMAHLGATYLTGSTNEDEGKEREGQPVASGEN